MTQQTTPLHHPALLLKAIKRHPPHRMMKKQTRIHKKQPAPDLITGLAVFLFRMPQATLFRFTSNLSVFDLPGTLKATGKRRTWGFWLCNDTGRRKSSGDAHRTIAPAGFFSSATLPLPELMLSGERCAVVWIFVPRAYPPRWPVYGTRHS